MSSDGRGTLLDSVNGVWAVLLGDGDFKSETGTDRLAVAAGWGSDDAGDTVHVTGMVPTRADTPHVPLSPEEIAETVAEGAHQAPLATGEADEAPEPNRKGRKKHVDEELIKLLGAAFRASKRDDDGWASLSEMGRRAGNRSSFDARNYGYARLSELIEALPNFATEKREGGAVYVKRVR